MVTSQADLRLFSCCGSIVPTVCVSVCAYTGVSVVYILACMHLLFWLFSYRLVSSDTLFFSPRPWLSGLWWAVCATAPAPLSTSQPLSGSACSCQQIHFKQLGMGSEWRGWKFKRGQKHDEAQGEPLHWDRLISLIRVLSTAATLLEQN